MTLTPKQTKTLLAVTLVLALVLSLIVGFELGRHAGSEGQRHMEGRGYDMNQIQCQDRITDGPAILLDQRSEECQSKPGNNVSQRPTPENTGKAFVPEGIYKVSGGVSQTLDAASSAAPDAKTCASPKE